MYDPNDGSNPHICGAPWNEGDDGTCECTRCLKHKRQEARDRDYEPPDDVIGEAKYWGGVDR